MKNIYYKWDKYTLNLPYAPKEKKVYTKTMY